MARSLAMVVTTAGLVSCSEAASSGAGATGGAAGSSQAGGAAGSGHAGSGGASGSTGGVASGGGGASTSGDDSGSAGSGAAVDSGASAGHGGAGGVNTGGFAGAMSDGSADANHPNGGADATLDSRDEASVTAEGGPSGFVCNQVTAMTLTREWFEAGFETDDGIMDAKWQLKAREHGYITEWSNPNSDFWNEKLESPCRTGSTNPDHVVLTVLSWVPACCTTQPQWEAQVDRAVSTLKAKYSALLRIDLMTVIRGPGNARCPADPTAGETIAMPPELDAALAAIATKYAGLVYVAPKFEAPNCAAFSGGGPHLTTAGNTAVAKDIAAYFAKLQ